MKASVELGDDAQEHGTSLPRQRLLSSPIIPMQALRDQRCDAFKGPFDDDHVLTPGECSTSEMSVGPFLTCRSIRIRFRRKHHTSVKKEAMGMDLRTMLLCCLMLSSIPSSHVTPGLTLPQPRIQEPTTQRLNKVFLNLFEEGVGFDSVCPGVMVGPYGLVAFLCGDSPTFLVHERQAWCLVAARLSSLHTFGTGRLWPYQV
ncbi:uncharacterized protein ARMOST_04288 [Armillaria ostoyae]|uniref:Uncharacterized protein n=1 Tax=Armillaria ostoyae TaxID=47428 RepID=A0A284QWY9_ARMOS|nr:uncharacterized protein ARMOST_04288 [Armillaria ostoyae]